jgi:uncharacterized protein HemX
MHPPQGEPAEGQTSVPRPEERPPTADDQARVVRIQIEQPTQGRATAGGPGGLWVALAVIALIVVILAAAFVVGAIHGVTGAVQQQTGVLAGQVRALNQIDHDLNTLIQTIQQAVQAITSRLPGG